jgi:RNA polymerase sigma-70 factor (ECF subfamily)
VWPDQLGALFDAHQGRLYGLARRLARDPEDARDLVQETFLRAARHPRALQRRDGDPEAWLVRVLVNLCRDRQRRQRVRQQTPDERLPSPLADPDPESAAVARATVQRALAELSPKRRAVLVLYELEQQPVPRVAELLGLSQVTVRWHLSSGRKELARRLAPLSPGAKRKQS